MASESTKRYVLYARVSTEKQGRSGLGLEAQRSAMQLYVEMQKAEIIGQYVDVESGTVDERPELASALRHVRRERAVLLVAKHDRLARNPRLVLELLETTRVESVETGPDASVELVQLKALLAGWESRWISMRTKAALAAKKARGGTLGSPDFGSVRHLGPARMKKMAAERDQSTRMLLADLRTGGIDTLQGLADELMRRGVKTARGLTAWTPTQVRRIECR